MSDRDPKSEKEDELLDRDAILARRSRFVAAALAGLAGASLIAACGGNVADDKEDAASPSPCLSPTATPVDAGRDGTPQPCLEPPIDRDAEPQPCLSIAIDAEAPDASDAGPQPCLAPPPG